MKRNKLLMGLVIGIFIIFIMTIFYIFNYSDIFKNLINKEDTYYGVINKYNLDYDRVSSIFNDYFVVSKDKKLGIVDKNNNLMLDFIYDNNSYIELYNDNYLILKRDNLSYLFDKDLNNILSDIKGDLSVYYDQYTSKYYYVYNSSVYNSSNELVYKFNDGRYYAYISCDFIDLDNNSLYNISDKKIYYNSEIITISSDNILIKVDKEYRLYDLKTSKYVSYNKLDDHGNYYVLSNDSNSINISAIFGEILDSKLMYKLNDKYYKSYGTCDSGSSIVSKDGEVIIDECYNYYSLHNDIIIASGFDDESTDVYINGILKYSGVSFISDKYIQVYDVDIDDDYKLNYHLYELSSGEEIPNICDGYLEQIGDTNPLYICNGEVLFDNNLEDISEDYDSIYTTGNDHILIFKKDNLYGLILDGETYIEPNYLSIQVMDNYVILNQLFGINVFEFGEVENKDELIDDVKFILNEPYSDIDVDLVIKENNLYNIEKDIKNDPLLFKKYYYIISNSDNLIDYKDMLFNIFRVIIDNKNLLDENQLLSGLKDLEIINVGTFNLEFDGLYYNLSKRIELYNDSINRDRVLYHELLHFLDYNFSYGSKDSIFICNNKISKVDSGNCSEEYIGNTLNFITEAGAEVYVGRYFNDYVEVTYENAVNLYNIFEYLFGVNQMRDMYFSNDSNYLLYNMLGNYLNSDDTFEFVENFQDLNSSSTRENKVRVVDYLIKIYENKYQGKWYDDPIFVFMLDNFLGITYYDYNDTPNYELLKEYLKMESNDLFYSLGFVDQYSLQSSDIKVIIDNDDIDKCYLVFSVYKYSDNGSTRGYIRVDYDFNDSKINDYVWLPGE